MRRPLTIVTPLGAVAVSTALALLIDADPTAAALLMVAAVLLAAFRGLSAGLVASFVAALSLSYFFVPPEREFSLGKRDDVVALVTFVALAIVVSTLFTEAQRARREAEEAAVREAEALAASELSRTRAAFFAAAGHNLRTPLTTVRAAVDAVLEHGSELSPEERDLLLGTVRDEAERLDRLTSKILQVARIRAGGLVVERERLDLAGLAQAAIGRVAPTDGGLRWVLDVEDGAPPLDLTMTEQVLLNLLENAVRFAPGGSRVTVTGRVTEGAYELAVADHGPGVPAADREAVFDEFWSGGDRAGGGSGLGLAIVRALTEAQGGTVRCHETPGGGATFVVRLPEPR